MSQANAFTQYLVTALDGTIKDISANVTSAKGPFDRDPIDLTTFGTGGARAADHQVQGAINAPVTLELLVDDVIYDLLEQLVGNNAGSLFQRREGKNKEPETGDVIFYGTYTWVSAKFSLKAGDAQKVSCELVPTDGGSVIPQFGRL